jgi:hypothetical protein
MASTYLSKTFGSAGNRKTFTISTWVKLGKIQTSGAIFSARSGSPWGILDIGTGDGVGSAHSLQFSVTAGVSPGVYTSQIFRDPSAWYHIVCAVDTTQATDSNRVKIYINGIQSTLLSGNYPTLNQDTQFNSTIAHYVGAEPTSSNYFDGSMAHVHFIDGTAYDASAFGLTDATTGIWKPKTVPSVTYGTNGFFLKFENSASFGTDSSGNANNFTVNGTMTQTIDTPSNVFATFNPLAKSLTGTSTYSNGNTTVTTDDTATLGGMSTLGITSGKWYAEAKRISQNSGAGDDGFRISFGVTNVTNHSTNVPSTTTGNYFMIGNGTVYNGSSDLGVLGGSANISNNGVQQIALDLDNNRITWGFNGQWMDGSGNYNQSSPSNYVTITDPDNTDAGYFFLTSDGSTARGYTASWNFGNGYFGTTAVSSAENPDDGIGIFEYEVPTGYKALCTKSINAQEYS